MAIRRIDDIMAQVAEGLTGVIQRTTQLEQQRQAQEQAFALRLQELKTQERVLDLKAQEQQLKKQTDEFDRMLKQQAMVNDLERDQLDAVELGIANQGPAEFRGLRTYKDVHDSLKSLERSRSELQQNTISAFGQLTPAAQEQLSQYEAQIQRVQQELTRRNDEMGKFYLSPNTLLTYQQQWKTGKLGQFLKLQRGDVPGGPGGATPAPLIQGPLNTTAVGASVQQQLIPFLNGTQSEPQTVGMLREIFKTASTQGDPELVLDSIYQQLFAQFNDEAKAAAFLEKVLSE